MVIASSFTVVEAVGIIIRASTVGSLVIRLVRGTPVVDRLAEVGQLIALEVALEVTIVQTQFRFRRDVWSIPMKVGVALGRAAILREVASRRLLRGRKGRKAQIVEKSSNSKTPRPTATASSCSTEFTSYCNEQLSKRLSNRLQ